jgi:hypothetical protein
MSFANAMNLSANYDFFPFLTTLELVFFLFTSSITTLFLCPLLPLPCAWAA